MKTTYLWRIPDDYPQRLIGGYQDAVSPDRFLFKMGEPLPTPLEQPSIRFDATLGELSKFDCLCSNAMIPLVNFSVAEALMKICSDEVEFIKTKVTGNDGVLDDYLILNATRKVYCIDRDGSEYTSVPGTDRIMSFRKATHLENCLGEHKIARDTEYLSHLVVSDVIKELFTMEKFTGIALINPSDISW